MKAFMDKEFMLQSATAQHLYHDYAEDMPSATITATSRPARSMRTAASTTSLRSGWAAATRTAATSATTTSGA